MPLLFFAGRLLRVPGYSRLPMVFHQGVKRLFNIYTVYEGRLRDEEPTLYVCNHTSYLDVFVLGSVLNGSFIAKSEVAGWPVFGKLAKIQNTLFFERNIRRAREQIDAMHKHLVERGNLILFPEGTSTDGVRVEPFRSSLFEAAIALPGEPTVWVQPVTVAYTHYDDLPMGRAERDFYAWYLPMTFLPHFVYGLGLKRCTVKVTFHKPVQASDFESRKAWALHCEQVVRQGLLAAIHVEDAAMKPAA